MARSRSVGEPAFTITSVVRPGDAAAVRAFAAAAGLKVGVVIRLALSQVIGIDLTTDRDKAKVVGCQFPVGDAVPSLEPISGPNVLLACLLPVSLADQVIAEAKARGITTAGLVRYSLTVFTGIEVAQPKDYPRTPELAPAQIAPAQIAPAQRAVAEDDPQAAGDSQADADRAA